LALYFNQYNFSSADYRQHEERYRGYQYSFVNDVKRHPELLHLVTMYLHPNGTRYMLDPVNGNFSKYNSTLGFLNRYCLNGEYCDYSLYKALTNRLVYLIDAVTRPTDASVDTIGVLLDADTGEILWQSMPQLPAG